MKKYIRKKLALGGDLDQYNTLNAVVGSPSPITTSNIGTGLISKVPNSVSATGPTMTSKVGSGMSAGGYQAAASLGTGLMDAIDGGNQYGNQSSGVTIGKGALTGAAAGATAGSVIPGIGTAIGAIGGAVIGGVTGIINAKKIKRKERQLFADQNVARNKYDNAVSNALANDQGLVEGYKGASYFKMGGKILGRGLKYADGGPIKPGRLAIRQQEPFIKDQDGLFKLLSKTPHASSEDLNFLQKAALNITGDRKDVDAAYNTYNKLVDYTNNPMPSGNMSKDERNLRTKIASSVDFGYPKTINQVRNLIGTIGKASDTNDTRPNKKGVSNETQDLRHEMIQQYLGINDNPDKLTESQYRPSKEGNPNTKYLDYNDKVKESMLNGITSFDDMKNAVNHSKLMGGTKSDPNGGYLNLRKFYGDNDAYGGLNQLGTFTMGNGKDKRGEYVSYYDNWDLNPKILSDKGVNLNAVNKPFEVYGRIYKGELDSIKADNPNKVDNTVFKPYEGPVTKLDPTQEQSYKSWKSKLPGDLQYDGNYDLRGLYKENPNAVPSSNLHFPDKYKLPNHPTFSNQSIYFNDKTKNYAGKWEDTDSSYNYIPFNPNVKDTVIEKKYRTGGLLRPTYDFGGPIKGAPVHDLPPDNRRIRNIDSLATAWNVPTTSISTMGLYNYGDTKANGGIPRRMDYVGPNGHQFYDYYDDATRGTTSYNTGTLPKFADGGQLMRPDSELLNGPSISSQPTSGGEAQPLNSQSTEMIGNSHTQGGIQLPQLGAELENGETTTGNFVFSKELGFAKLHRPIAKAIGKIEKKPSTPDRRNALQLLKGQEERLALSQEQYKIQNGIK